MYAKSICANGKLNKHSVLTHVYKSVSFSETGLVFQNARPPGQRQPARAPRPPSHQRGGQRAAARSRVPELPLRPLYLLSGRHQRRGGWALQPSPEPHDYIRCLKQPQGRKRCVCRCMCMSVYVCIWTLCLTGETN